VRPTDHAPTAHALVLTTILLIAGALGVARAAAHDVLVFAASSLTDALGAAVARYEQRRGDRIVLAFASSSSLARQIENGAPADLYVSADVLWMDYLQERHLVDAKTRTELLSNRLVLVAPTTSSLQPAELRPGFPIDRWLGEGRLAMGNPEHVPAGLYGKQALKSLRAWAPIRRKIARAEDVRAALALVALGEAPLGVVYYTDAHAEDSVKIIGTFPEATHAPIVYPAALTATSEGRAARDFLAYLRSDRARMLFEQYGFKAPP
jgi:molybdate transport system substrate-binding protein